MSGRFLLLYGSQTGQAQAIAEEIEENAPIHGLRAERHCLSLTEKRFCIEDETCVVLVVSTTGEGDPPETAEKFWRRLKKRSLAKTFLKNLHFTLLGLGDSNYNSFCVCSRNFEKRLGELGATTFYDTAFADDAVGLEVVVEPWLEGLWPALHKELKVANPPISINLHNKTSAICESDINNSKLLANILKMEIAAINNKESIVDTASDTTSVVPTQDIGSISDNSINVIEIDKQSSVNDSSIKLTSENSSLTSSVEPLKSEVLTVPRATIHTLKVEYLPTSNPVIEEQNWKRPLPPIAVSEIIDVPLVSAIKLTDNDNVKKTWEIIIDINNADYCFLPGDSIGIFAPNDKEEVRKLLKRLNLMDQESVPCKIVQPPGKKLPKHIPEVTTLFSLFSDYCDIRSIPKKKFLSILSTYSSDEKDKRRLEELSSRQGADDYTKFILNSMISLLDLLDAFPSCQPPVECILENVPALLPRYYSIANSPLVDPNLIKFVFNVAEIPIVGDRHCQRLGVCTGWLQRIADSHRNSTIAETSQVMENAMQKLSLSAVDDITIPIFLRKSNNFRLPIDTSVPIVLIGPGTGIAPFIGFLEHRHRQKQDLSSESFGDVWLFYGCRHKKHDFIYKNFLQQMIENGTLTRLLTSFSRDTHEASGDNASQCNPKYVQDNIWICRKELMNLIHTQGAVVYVCGDAKGMAKDVHGTMINILQQELELSEFEAQSYIRKMQDEKRYLQDIWT